MILSTFGCFAAMFLTAALVVLAAPRLVHRRLRHGRTVRAAVVVAAAVLVPANLYCALHHPMAGDSGMTPVLVQVVTLTAALGLVVLVLSSRIGNSPTARPRRVLAVGAHPDDLELGCGGTLAKLADSGHEVLGLVMTRGERGGDAASRRGEAVDSGEFVGLCRAEVLALPDTRLAENSLEMVAAIERAVARFNPDIVLTHSAHDQHQDHQAVHLATLRAARGHSSILCYESPSATADFRPSVFVDISDHIDVKTTAVGAHVDQRGKPYMTGERVRGLAVYRGGQAKVRHAEGYEPVRMLGMAMEQR